MPPGTLTGLDLDDVRGRPKKGNFDRLRAKSIGLPPWMWHYLRLRAGRCSVADYLRGLVEQDAGIKETEKKEAQGCSEP